MDTDQDRTPMGKLADELAASGALGDNHGRGDVLASPGMAALADVLGHGAPAPRWRLHAGIAALLQLASEAASVHADCAPCDVPYASESPEWISETLDALGEHAMRAAEDIATRSLDTGGPTAEDVARGEALGALRGALVYADWLADGEAIDAYTALSDAVRRFIGATA